MHFVAASGTRRCVSVMPMCNMPQQGRVGMRAKPILKASRGWAEQLLEQAAPASTSAGDAAVQGAAQSGAAALPTPIPSMHTPPQRGGDAASAPEASALRDDDGFVLVKSGEDVDAPHAEEAHRPLLQSAADAGRQQATQYAVNAAELASHATDVAASHATHHVAKAAELAGHATDVAASHVDAATNAAGKAAASVKGALLPGQAPAPTKQPGPVVTVRRLALTSVKAEIELNVQVASAGHSISLSDVIIEDLSTECGSVKTSAKCIRTVAHCIVEKFLVQLVDVRAGAVVVQQTVADSSAGVWDWLTSWFGGSSEPEKSSTPAAAAAKV
eukprot:TRINITY_DN8467_c0_g1_i1.p1 TRINITY_DN8467_c0_g1~~TRINITY_DN8467_c0_g1_i1.p1  ORF type:complete len:330 (-),score=88.32 TRINITY_DN8467_c0_g1_i1:99-1088(-)